MASKLDEETVSQLVKTASAMRDQSYCPYSKFRVGAAVLCEDGTVVTGANVENASYGLSVCAERVAVMNAACQGHRKFKALAVACDVKSKFQSSCGACLQVMSEFSMELELYLVKPDGSSTMSILKDLMPMAFEPFGLSEERVYGNYDPLAD